MCNVGSHRVSHSRGHSAARQVCSVVLRGVHLTSDRRDRAGLHLALCVAVACWGLCSLRCTWSRSCPRPHPRTTVCSPPESASAWFARCVVSVPHVNETTWLLPVPVCLTHRAQCPLVHPCGHGWQEFTLRPGVFRHVNVPRRLGPGAVDGHGAARVLAAVLALRSAGGCMEPSGRCFGWTLGSAVAGYAGASALLPGLAAPPCVPTSGHEAPGPCVLTGAGLLLCC